jgi:hypothetical protein
MQRGSQKFHIDSIPKPLWDPENTDPFGPDTRATYIHEVFVNAHVPFLTHILPFRECGYKYSILSFVELDMNYNPRAVLLFPLQDLELLPLLE